MAIYYWSSIRPWQKEWTGSLGLIGRQIPLAVNESNHNWKIGKLGIEILRVYRDSGDSESSTKGTMYDKQEWGGCFYIVRATRRS
jgi:hypothetical protein